MNARRMAWAVAAVLLGHAAPTTALDFFGYFRDSVGGNSNGGAQACFKTPGMDYKLRLGNECDNYGEWGLQQRVWTGKDGVEFTVGFMFSYAPDAMTTPGTGTPFQVQQNYVKVKMPQLHGAQFWAGKQYYRRENVDMIDFYYLNTSEPGAGIEDYDLGFGKLAASVFSVKGKTQGDYSVAFWRPDARVYGIPVNPDGTLEVDANLVLYSSNPAVPKGPNDATASVWVTVEHTQDKLMGGHNKVALQWANGAAAQMAPGTPAYGADPVNKNNMQLRIVDELLLQPSAKFQTLVGTVLQWKTFYEGTADALVKTDATQIGIFGRPVYYVSDYFKVQGDLGWTQDKHKGASAMNLFKFCLAPTLTPMPGDSGGYFVRPEIRAFVTYGAWNDAAASATDPNSNPPGATLAPGGGLFGTSESGFSFGFSVETWF